MHCQLTAYVPFDIWTSLPWQKFASSGHAKLTKNVRLGTWKLNHHETGPY